MSEDGGRRFQCRLFDDRHQIFQTGRLVDGSVESADPFTGDPGTTWMRIHDHRVPTSNHVDDIARQCRQRMGHRSDRADYSERSVLGDRQPVIATDGVCPKIFHARYKLDDFQLFDLVIESTDLGLFELQSTQLFSLLVTNPTDDFNHRLACGQRCVTQLLEALGRRGNGLINGLEHAHVSVPLRRGRLGGFSQLSQHFLYDTANRFCISLHSLVSRSLLRKCRGHEL